MIAEDPQVAALLQRIRDESRRLCEQKDEIRLNLAAARRQLGRQWEQSTRPLAVIDHAGRVRRATASLAALLDKEALPRDADFGSLVAAEDLELWREFLDDLGSGRQGRRCELSLLRADRARLPVALDAANVRGGTEGPEIMLWVSESRERRRLEAALGAADERLRASAGELRERSAQLARLTHQLDQAQFEDRRRLAEYLHDDIQQLLVAARIQAVLASREAGAGAHGHLQTLLEIMDLALASIRGVVQEMRPASMVFQGVAEALEAVAQEFRERHDLVVTLHPGSPQLRGLDRRFTDTLLRCVRELLFNVVKHAGTGAADLRVAATGDGWLRVTVHDRGCGFDPASSPGGGGGGGLGLFAVRERLAQMGGDLQVESTPGEGTVITISAPLP